MYPRGWTVHLGAPMCARSGGRVAATMLLLALAAGCTASHQPTNSPTTAKVTECGSTRTAAHVPVNVEIAKGHVSCATAMMIEKAYANAIRSGLAPGNGGGGPVTIKGWTCQGFATPVVLSTGKASKCVNDGDEILEVLPQPA